MNKSPNTWTNQFGDRIISDGSIFNGKKYTGCYFATIKGQESKSFGGLIGAKNFINTERGLKCNWTETIE